MNGLEKLSLLKMDFLGLTTLTIIADALKLIERHRGVKLTVEEIPMDDPHTYTQIFSKALTSGVFQFESAGMRDVLRRYQPDRVEDLIALNALYRPGPMDMIDDFVDRKHGRKEVVYDVPELKEILEETYGVMVYQEQVMQISNRIAGYSLGDADLLRRAMGKKKVEEMASTANSSSPVRRKTAIRPRRPRKFSIRWKNSPATALTSRIRRPTRTWPASPGISKRTIPSSSCRRCSRRKLAIPQRWSSTSMSAARCASACSPPTSTLPIWISRPSFPDPTKASASASAPSKRRSKRRRVHRESPHRGRCVHLALRFLRACRSRRSEPPHDRKLHQGRSHGYPRRHSRPADGRNR